VRLQVPGRLPGWYSPRDQSTDLRSPMRAGGAVRYGGWMAAWRLGTGGGGDIAGIYHLIAGTSPIAIHYLHERLHSDMEGERQHTTGGRWYYR